MITQTTLRPGQKGTKGLAKKYGDRLVCVRHKFDSATKRRVTTVELIEEETELRIEEKLAVARTNEGPPQRLGIRVDYWETDLREKVKAAGGIWRPRHKLWEMPYKVVVELGLESRVVATDVESS